MKPQGRSATPLRVTVWRASCLDQVHSVATSNGLRAVSRLKVRSFESSSLFQARV